VEEAGGAKVYVGFDEAIDRPLMSVVEKVRYWSRDLPQGSFDYIVIGSGMGGMTAAALLSKMGRRVLVVEQHVIPGGFTQTFTRPGYKWDVGVHLVGEMTERSYLGRLLTDLTNGRLEWASVGEIYDEFNFPDGFTIQFPNSKPAFRETLYEYFPSERQAIDRYLDLVRAASRSAAGYLQTRVAPTLLAPGAKRRAKAAMPFFTATTAEVLEGLTDDPRLRAVLAAQWGYYGSTPAKSSFAMHALMVAHFLWGAYYPAGTAESIARELLRTVSDSGGWTLIRTEVESIVVRGGRAIGVKLADGSEISAGAVISAVGAASTAGLLPGGVLGQPEYMSPGPAHVSLYLGFEGDISRAGGAKYSQWFYETWDMERDIWPIEPNSELPRADVLYCSFPSLKDPRHDPGPSERHTGEIITFVPWESFAQWRGTRWKKRGAEYDEFKDQVTAALLSQYLEHYSELESLIAFTELSTPLSTHHFARAHRGSIYGLASEPDRFTSDGLTPKAGVRGLYMAGVDVMAPGIAGAIGGGTLAVAAAEPVSAMRYLRPIMKG
jgi:all-trans-retinol 13,14-reductase